MVTLRYPDIASYQAGIDLSSVQAVCAKVTEGTGYTNPDYVAFMAEAAAHGAFFFCYHFLTQGNGAAQADYCYSKAGSAPLMLDFEPVKDNSENYTSKPSVADATSFIDRYRARGGTCNVLYLPRWYWTELGSPSLQPFIDRRMVLVSSNYAATYTDADSGAGWLAYGGMSPVIWQYTNAQKLNGKAVDYNAFRGALDEFKALVNEGSMPRTADALIATAARDLGYKEGSTTPYGVWYASLPGNSGQGFESASWCDMFVSYCANKAGMSDLVGRHAYVPFHMAWFKTAGIWHPGAAGIQRGDVIIFEWEADSTPDHIGIVESVDAAGIHTIEGNTGSPDGVYRVIRSGAVVMGYGRPRYTQPAISRPELSAGASGSAVIYLQQRLNLWGAKLDPDGDFGSLTVAAVEAFQQGHHLDPDGVVGPLTWAELDKTPPARAHYRHVAGDGNTLNTISLEAYATSCHTTVTKLVSLSKQFLAPAHVRMLDAYLALAAALVADGNPPPPMPKGMIIYTLSP